MNVSMALVTFYAILHIGPKVSVNQVPAIYTSLPRAFVFARVTGVIFIVLVVLHVRMIFLLRRRADVLASMTSNQNSTSAAQASTDAMVYLSFFVTGKRLSIYPVERPPISTFSK